MSDHPRSCGANDTAIFTVSRAAGSSPLVRGQLVFWWPVVILLRIIPARAGPTAETLRLAPSRADHPRSCGANINTTFYPHRSYGSSPLVRGQRSPRAGSRTRCRIIPARAGPTAGRLSSACTSADHPRSCGANHEIAATPVFHLGSSPLVRGQPFCGLFRIVFRRIIPARAGPTRDRIPEWSSASDHPRSCGANLGVCHADRGHAGSSPLVRGQRRSWFRFPLALRIIPARAGPTREIVAFAMSKADHPRSCGANYAPDFWLSDIAGSSPLVRGQPSRASRIRVDPRIIPARAGPTVRLSYEAGDDPDHPRSCGANR